MPEQPDGTLTQHQRLAAHFEQRFAQAGRTLTDARTAEDVRIALGAVVELLKGARVQGLITEDAHADLENMVVALMEAPGLLG